ncbi:hypothetical protein ACOSP7_017331 [Xanthoceras sorbifolium]
MAALWKPLKWVSISVLVFMLVFTPLLHSFRTRFHGGTTTMAEGTTTATAKQELEKRWFGNRGGWSKAVDQKSVEDSAREVPTGPDPLHHNHNPTGP